MNRRNNGRSDLNMINGNRCIKKLLRYMSILPPLNQTIVKVFHFIMAVQFVLKYIDWQITVQCISFTVLVFCLETLETSDHTIQYLFIDREVILWQDALSGQCVCPVLQQCATLTFTALFPGFSSNRPRS